MKILFYLAALVCSEAFTAPLAFRTPLSTKLNVISAKDGKAGAFVIPLERVCLDDIPQVGGKTASLGEMIQELMPLGVDVPGGFAVTSTAYDAVLDQFHLRERLSILLDDLDGTNAKRRFGVCIQHQETQTHSFVFSFYSHEP